MESERPPTDRTGTIGIIGAGHIGQALARTALRAGREVVIANSRGAQSLAPVVAALGAGVSAGTVHEAAAAGIVAIAVPRTSVPASDRDAPMSRPHGRSSSKRLRFVLGALLSATAPSAGLFIAGRIILGVSTGLLRVVAVPPLLQRFPVEPPHDRGVHQYRGLRTIPHTGPPRPASRR